MQSDLRTKSVFGSGQGRKGYGKKPSMLDPSDTDQRTISPSYV